MKPWLRGLLFGVALLIGAGSTLLTWRYAAASTYGADFASYYYAVLAAAAGDDPYITANLVAAAEATGVRRGVHPFFYPPPFLLLMQWVRGLSLQSAYWAWFVVDLLAGLSVAGLLAAWWRDRGGDWPWLAWMGVLSLTAVANNHGMGQVNLPVLAFVLGGLWATERDRPVQGGALVGLACMLKMSPAFFVLWWMLRGRWRAVVAACVTGALLSVAALAVVPFAVQLRFYTEVLPAFSSGDYNGLRVPISLWANHSVPDVLNAVWPGAQGELSATARRLSSGFTILLLSGLAAAFWRRGPDRVAVAGQVGAVGIATLLVPVYTYEHHLVYALPAMVAVLGAVSLRRLPRLSLLLWIPAWVVLAMNLGLLRGATATWTGTAALLAEEAKFIALLVFFAGSIWVGRTTQRRGTSATGVP